MGAPRTDHQNSMEERLGDAGATLDRLSVTAKDLGGAVRDELREMIEQLRSERDTLLQKLKQARALDDDAWEEYRQTVDRAHERFAADLAIAEAELRRRRAETRKEFADTVDEELDAWRARIDELRVQARLARMDSGDELEPVIEAMQRRSSELEGRLGELREASEEAWRSIREDITDGFVQLRRSLRQADDNFPG